MAEYRTDPLWMQAQQQYVLADGTPDEKMVRAITAALSMRYLEAGDRDMAAVLLRGSAA